MFLSLRRNLAGLALFTAMHVASADPANLFLGNPSQAGATDKNNLLVEKDQFSLSYNNTAGEPNWVSWRLTKANLGEAPRKAKFSEDTTLPEGITRVTSKDYQDCGFDRGHICPHGDRASNKVDSYATFVMTNIVPQSAQLNRHAWNQLEIYLRTLASSGQRVYIVSGPVGKGGGWSQGASLLIGRRKGRSTSRLLENRGYRSRQGNRRLEGYYRRNPCPLRSHAQRHLAQRRVGSISHLRG